MTKYGLYMIYKEYSENEFGSAPDWDEFQEPDGVGIGYTTLEENELIELQVTLYPDDFQIIYFINGQEARQVTFDDYEKIADYINDRDYDEFIIECREAGIASGLITENDL